MSSKSPSSISISTGTILRVIGILLALATLWLVRDILLYLFMALLLAGVMYPLVRWAAKYHIPRGISVIVCYILLFGLIGFTFALLIPPILIEARQFTALYADGTSWQWITNALNAIREFATHYSLPNAWQTSMADLQGQFSQGVAAVASTLLDIFGGIAGLVIVLVLAFYLIVEESAVKTLFHNLVPEKYQIIGSRLVWQVIDRLGGWLRGQIVLCVLIGVLYFIAFSLIGLPYALLLALLGGVFEFIPYLGPIVSAVPAIILAATISPWHVLAVLAATILIQQAENHIIVPKVMEKTIGLNPIISILAVMAGANLFGFVGVLFAIPVATAVSVVITELLGTHKAA
jgi:predicted PurR-regulated permease PerM